MSQPGLNLHGYETVRGSPFVTTGKSILCSA